MYASAACFASCGGSKSIHTVLSGASARAICNTAPLESTQGRLVGPAVAPAASGSPGHRPSEMLTTGEFAVGLRRAALFPWITGTPALPGKPPSTATEEKTADSAN